MTPQELVCSRCWSNFFNTEDFERCCTFDYLQRDRKHVGIEVAASTSQIRSADCTWCAYIRSFIRDSWMPEDRVTTSLSPSQISSCTPKGGNVFYLSISCHNPAGKWIGGSALFLHAWTTTDDNASKYVTARPVQTDVNSEAARVQLKTWLEECAGHKTCRTLHQDRLLPTRVIEINPPGKQHPRILKPGELHGVYATLSYCWGKEYFPTLTLSNYAELTERLDLLTMPPTICDAISTARNLSIPYLWIDSLCIIQDCAEDKIKEIALMNSIYASSALTIVAASAKSVSKGFLQPRVHSETTYKIPVRVGSNVFGTMSVNELDAACYDERLEPIAKRAWTMQEQLLARRTLTFTSHTMMWRCHMGTRNFGDSLFFPHDLDAGYNDNDEKYSLNLDSLLLEEEACIQKDKALSCWLRLVTAYSLRIASMERDKLNAVAGIASHPSFSRTLGPHYWAGLWQYDLARQLTWRTSSWHRTLAERESAVYRPVNYRAPSWSWASIEGGVVRFDFSFDNEDESAPELICDIIHCSTEPTSPELNPFGEVLSAQLRVKAAVRRAWFNPSTSNIFLLFESQSGRSRMADPYHEASITITEASTRHLNDFMTRYPDVNLSEDPEAAHGTDFRNMCGTYDETGNHEPILVLCVGVTLSKERDDGVEGLLLLPNDVKGENGIFKRIGLFERGRNEDFRTEAMTEISII